MGLAAVALAAVGLVGGLGLIVLRAARGPSPADGGLNVLLVTCDTTRADRLGCYGWTAARTPNIDRLAAEGVRFTRCSSCSPLTTPSHASILTGTYPFVHGVRDNGNRRLGEANVTLAEVLRDQGYATHAVVAAFVVNSLFGLAQGFTTYQDVEPPPGANSYQAERPGDAVSADAVRALRDLAASRFFMWVHFYDPHDSYRYEQEIAFMDVQIGRLLQALQELKLERNTLVVLVGDHGEGLGEHDEDYHGDFLYESTLNVPLIFRLPGVLPAGSVRDERVRIIDVPATILDLAGAPAIDGAQGVSLAPVMSGSRPDPDLAAYGEALKGQLQFGLAPLRSLTTRDWKYVLAPEPELYDLKSDPGERNNLIGAHAQRELQMRAALRELIRTAPVPKPAQAVDLQPAERAQLESLGYVGAARSSTETDELANFEPRGDDPKQHKQTMRLYGKASVALKSGDYAGAQQMFEQVIAAAPGSAVAHGDLAYALQAQGRTEQAIELYREALELAPELVHIRKMYAGLFVSQRRWDEAVVELTEVLAQAPYDAEMHYGMGISLTSLGRLDEGYKHFEQALAISPNSPRYLSGLGVACERQQRYEEAARHFQRALEISPNHEPSRRGLEGVRRAMGGG